MKSSITIERIKAREILDSRGNPTVEVQIMLSDGSCGTAAVPSGASTGKYEALELRDEDRSRYHGLGVLKAVSNVNNVISAAIKGLSPFKQPEFDHKLIELDGTHDKSRLGANAILGASMACARAAAVSRSTPLYSYLGKGKEYILPVPMMNILNGGKHAADSTDFQEFMVVPAGAQSFSESLRMGAEIYHSLKNAIKARNLNTNVGDEGGFAPAVTSNKAAIELILEAIDMAGYRAGIDCMLALDAAASSFYQKGKYFLSKEESTFSAAEMVDYYVKWSSTYPLISIEDGLSEDDWDAWKLLQDKIGSKVQLVGDDLYATNITRLKKGIEIKASNAVLIKLNQIGTLTETLQAMELARKINWTTIISHRSGETEDSFIADLSVATGAGQIKTGAPCRSERVVKYNRLLYIEQELGKKARFAGKEIFSQFGGLTQWS